MHRTSIERRRFRHGLWPWLEAIFSLSRRLRSAFTSAATRCAPVLIAWLLMPSISSATEPDQDPQAQGGAGAALSLERIHADPPLAGRLPRSALLSPGGRFVSYLQPSAADSQVLELWVQPLPSGAPRRLAAVTDLIGTREATLTEAEKMALERRRVTLRGITDYSWCGEQDQRLVVPLAGDLYLIELQGEQVRTQRLTYDEAEPERDPQCDPQGRQVAYVKRNDLWLQPLDGGPAKALSETGSDTRSTGLAEFIAAEEFDRHDGYWWSRDGRQLLALEVDEHEVPIKTRMQIRAEGSGLVRQRYPAAGDPNARVSALVIDAVSGRSRRLALPPSTEYIVRAGWFDDGVPWLQTMPRDQTALQLVEYVNGGAEPHVVLDERDSAWVAVHGDLHERARPDDAKSADRGQSALLWSSERSGRRQLWQIDRKTGASRQLTALPEPVVQVVCASAERTVFTAAQQRGRAQALFELDTRGRVHVIGPDNAQPWRTATADRACKRLLVQESAWGQPPRSSVITLGSKAALIALQGVDADPLLARIVPVVQSVELVAADGSTPLNAFYLPPMAPSSSSAGQAVIVESYGGPTGQTVGWFWSRRTPLYAYWQRLGFGVLLVDTRGMGARDRDFVHAHYRAFGNVEVADLFAAVRQLPAKVADIDPARIGVIGWSYGGYLALRAVLDEATPFAAAVAGAPVADWTLYDTAYTERYLGLPDGGKASAYRDASLPPRAASLGKPLLIVHGTADDNVLFEHSLRIVQALQLQGKLFETSIYPGQTHGIAGQALQLHVDRMATDFFVRRLKP